MASNKARPPPSNNDLPTGARSFYTAYFVPVLRKYVGAFDNPWVTDGLVGPIQTIWNGIMKDWPHTISDEMDAIYHLVSDIFCVQPRVLMCYYFDYSQFREFMNGAQLSAKPC